MEEKTIRRSSGARASKEIKKKTPVRRGRKPIEKQPETKTIIIKAKDNRGRKKIIKEDENTVTRRKKDEEIRSVKTRRTTRKTKTEEFGFKKEKLRIIPLGGLHEIGKNITVF